MMGETAGRSWPGRRLRRPALAAGLAVAALLLLAVPGQALATFTALTSSSGNSWAAAATFPTYPQSVANSGSWAYHRGDEAVSTAATSAVADSSGNTRPGTYRSPTDGASTWWRFNEGSGLVAEDSSGAANRGTLENVPGVTWAAGYGGGSAVSFTGASAATEYVEGRGPGVRTDQSFTVMAWVYLTAADTNRTAVSQYSTNKSGFFLKFGPGSPNRWVFLMPREDNTVGCCSDFAVSTSVPATNTWTHLAGVYDAGAGQIHLYVNGVLEGTAAHTTPWSATGALEVGRARWTGSPGDPWAGRVDDVRTYRRVVSGTGIQNTYSGASPAGMTAGLPGALQGATQGQGGSTAVAFRGTAHAHNNAQIAAPAAFTVECWFKATGSSGGTLIAFGSWEAGMSIDKDRLIFLDSGGRLTFGVYPGSVVTVRSPAAYNDGEWHHVAASLGAAGMRLYLDGRLVASHANTVAQTMPAGYWKFGGESLEGWPDRPTSDYLIGTLDEIAIYHTQLSDQQIAWHYHADH